MGILVSLFAALGATTIVYAWLGQGGGVSGLVFFGILLAGATINAARTARSPDALRSRSPALLT